MRKILSILSVATLMFAACDKIEPNENGEYTIYSGSTGVWVDGQAVSNHTQRALVEKYTGPKCVNCPTADNIMNGIHERLGEKMVMIAITPRGGDGEPYNGNPDMSTDDGEQWVAAFGVSALPRAFLNRDKSYESTGTMSIIEADIENATSEEAKVAISIAATNGDKIDIDVSLEFLQNVEQELSLTLALTEDSLIYWQASTSGLQKEYPHNHMLRDVITDVWGLDIDATGTKGECRKTTIQYTLPENVTPEKCHIVAFVADKTTRKVINSAECTLQ